MTKDTQGNQALIDEMIRDAKPAQVESELAKNPVVHKGDETLGAPMVVKEISSAGYVWVWDTRTFDRLPVLYYMLPQKLRQRREDGSFRFTTRDPGKLPKRGTIKCLLHEKGESREHYNTLGFVSCRKENITNLHQLRQHMSKKHPQEWKAIEEERKEKERQEDRELQHLLLKKNAPEEFACPDCDAVFTKKIALIGHSKTHKKE